MERRERQDKHKTQRDKKRAENRGKREIEKERIGRMKTDWQ